MLQESEKSGGRTVNGFAFRQIEPHQPPEGDAAAVIGAGTGDGVGVSEEVSLHVAHGEEAGDGAVVFSEDLGIVIHMEAEGDILAQAETECIYEKAEDSIQSVIRNYLSGFDSYKVVFA